MVSIKMAGNIILYLLVVAITIISYNTIHYTSSEHSLNKDYQIEIIPNGRFDSVIIWDNNRKVAICDPAVIDSVILSDNL